jgi:serine/threonine protein kinase
MATDIGTFVSRLSQSGILSPEELSRLPTQLPGGGGAETVVYSRALVDAGKLTAFQADALAADQPERLAYGRYLVLERIGQGGMGVVFKAQPRDRRDVVAVKVLPREFTQQADAVRRFRREVEAASKLSHPHIVAALDSGEEDGTHYYVMEYVPGDDLDDLVDTHGPLPVGAAVNCILHAAAGLRYVHEQGVIHRDVKPSNMLLDRNGRVRILDLGLARMSPAAAAADGAATALTKTGAVMGTVDYMSPEQAVNIRKADHRSDIYSLGCTLYFLLTGRPPFRGETVMETLVAHREEAVPSLRPSRRDVPERLDDIVRKALAKKPEARQQSMAELIVDLEACKAEHGLTWVIHKVVSKRGKFPEIGGPTRRV